MKLSLPTLLGILQPLSSLTSNPIVYWLIYQSYLPSVVGAISTHISVGYRRRTFYLPCLDFYRYCNSGSQIPVDTWSNRCLLPRHLQASLLSVKYSCFSGEQSDVYDLILVNDALDPTFKSLKDFLKEVIWFFSVSIDSETVVLETFKSHTAGRHLSGHIFIFLVSRAQLPILIRFTKLHSVPDHDLEILVGNCAHVQPVFMKQLI